MSFDPLSPTPPSDRTWGINFGGGTNSTALVIECFNRDMRPDWILFCDTGSERPETYAALDRLQAWLARHGRQPIEVTRWVRERPLEDGTRLETIEQHCLRTGWMPSAAYGYAGCSTKFKRQPAEKWRRYNGFGGSVFALGYDAGEERRVKRACERPDESDESPWYPLFAWGITRADCDAIILRAGLPPVPKSSCFFCPHMKRPEWEALKTESPDLFSRALAIESNAVANGNATEGGLLRGHKYLRDMQFDEPEPAEPACTPIACDCFESVDS